MTTPAPQPPPPSSGPDREEQAQQAGAAVGAALQAAEAAILASVAAAITAVLAGSLTVQMAKRKIRAAITAALGAAMHKVNPVISALPPSAQAPIRQAVLNAQASAAQSAAKALDAAAGKPPPGGPGGAGSTPGGSGGPGQPGSGKNTSELYQEQMDEAKGSKGGPYRDVADAHQAAVRAAMAEKMSRLKQAQRVMDDLASQGITGFTDKAGRNWSLSAYAEMATRTAQSRLILQNQLKLMGPAGVDLVIVDNPAMEAPCPRCRPYEGRVLALTGPGTGTSTITDASGVQRTEQVAGTLADAVAAGLLHPNCRHSLLPWHSGSGLVPTAGGAQRGYVVAGQSAPRSLPIGSPQDYDNEQRLRGHERAVRASQMRVSAALSPQAKRKARAHLAGARTALEAHVAATGATRLPGREKVFRADRKANPGQPYRAR
jgi:Phage minor capsid protein 2